MAQYKVPQDVEAEDKILGPLTMKQFIYGAIGIAWAFLAFFIFARVNLILFIIVAAPITILFGLLAGYKRDGQDFESLLLSLVSFFAQPRQRIWLKEPIAEVFRIEPPKVVVEQTQRDPAEVRSQLEQLANLVDSRGNIHKTAEPIEPVAIPNFGTSTLTMPDVAPMAEKRTVAIPAEQVATIADVVPAAEDILDFQHNASAQNLTAKVQESEEATRQQAIDAMRAQLAAIPDAAPAAALMLPNTPPIAVVAAPITATTAQPIAPVAAPMAQPVEPIAAPLATSSTSGMTLPPRGDIIRLATENDDLPVSQIAAQANRNAVINEGETVNLQNGSTSG